MSLIALQVHWKPRHFKKNPGYQVMTLLTPPLSKYIRIQPSDLEGWHLPKVGVKTQLRVGMTFKRYVCMSLPALTILLLNPEIFSKNFFQKYVYRKDNGTVSCSQSEKVFSALTHLCPPLRSTFAVRETASLGIMGAPRVPPLNPSETIVL